MAGDTTTAVFQPRFIFRNGKNGSADISVEAIRFTGNQKWQTELNEKIDALVERAISDAEVAKEGRSPGLRENYYVNLGIDLSYASPRLMSVHIAQSEYLGQAHPASGTSNLNFNPATARELAFPDLLEQADTKNIFELCRTQVAQEKAARETDGGNTNTKADVDPSEIASGTSELSNWRFQASSVNIDYGAYAFGGYGQCMCDCTIPYAALRPLAKRSSPLP